jgi:hypothetical protein
LQRKGSAWLSVADGDDNAGRLQRKGSILYDAAEARSLQVAGDEKGYDDDDDDAPFLAKNGAGAAVSAAAVAATAATAAAAAAAATAEAVARTTAEQVAAATARAVVIEFSTGLAAHAATTATAAAAQEAALASLGRTNAALAGRAASLEERLAANEANFAETLESLVNEVVGRLQRVESLQARPQSLMQPRRVPTRTMLTSC